MRRPRTSSMRLLATFVDSSSSAELWRFSPVERILNRWNRCAQRAADFAKRSCDGMKRRTIKILLIDDDKTVVNMLSAVLSAAGYQVISALDPVQGFMAVRREKPQLVLLDLMMPAGGGMPLLKKMTATGKVPVVVITSLTDGKVEAEAKAAGAAGFLKKPVDPELR